MVRMALVLYKLPQPTEKVHLKLSCIKKVVQHGSKTVGGVVLMTVLLQKEVSKLTMGGLNNV